MDSDAKLNILTEALAAAGASALAIDARGGVAISTMDDAALERDVADFVAERLDRIGDGARLVMGRAGTRLSLTVRPTAKEGGSLWVVVVREVRGAAAHAGIEWLNADEVEVRYESSTYGIVEGAAAVAVPVAESYARGVPLMLEGELGAGQVEIAKRLYLDGPFADQPFVSVALDELTDRGWRHVLKSAESPLFQTGLTLCIEGWNAVGPQRLRELVSTMADTALATRCHVVLTANDMPGGSESDQAAFVTERFACAVSVGDMVCREGIRRAAASLPTCVNNGDDLDARAELAFANTLGGYAMVCSGCAGCHGLEHGMSAHHHDLPHGAGLIMIARAYHTWMIDHGAAPERYIDMARLMGNAAADDPHDFVIELTRLMEACHVADLAMSEWGITADELPAIAHNALTTNGALFGHDPVALTDPDVVEILKRSYR